MSGPGAATLRSLPVGSSSRAATGVIGFMGGLALATFISIGTVKAAPWLAFVPVDLTALCALAVGLLVLWRAATDGVPEPPASMLLAVPLAAWICLSVVWSPDAAAGQSKAVEFVSLTLLALFAPLVLIRKEGDLNALMLGFVAFGVLTALTAESTGNEAKPLTVPGGNLTNQIDLGLQCAIGGLAALYFALSRVGIVRLLAVLTTAAMAGMVFAAGSRGVLVGFGLAFVYAIVVFARRTGRAGLVPLGVAGLVALLFIGPQVAGESAARYQDSLLGASPDTVLGQREYIFDTATSLAVDNPLGVGAAGYPALTNGLVYPHNIELELAVEFGLIAVVVFLCIVAGAWRVRRRVVERALLPASVAAGALIVCLVFDAQVSHDLNGTRPMWMALGLAFALPSLSRNAAAESPRAPGTDGDPPGAA